MRDQEGHRPQLSRAGFRGSTANLLTNIVDFRGFKSSIILIIRGGIPRPMRDFPESLSRAMLVGVMLVGRLGVRTSEHRFSTRTVVSPWGPVQKHVLLFLFGGNTNRRHERFSHQTENSEAPVFHHPFSFTFIHFYDLS